MVCQSLNGTSTLCSVLLKLIGGIVSILTFVPALQVLLTPSPWTHFLAMAPIVSPKILSQILMHGCAAIAIAGSLAESNLVPLFSLPLDSVPRLSITVKTKKIITDTPPSTLALLPNCTFIRKSKAQCIEDEGMSASISSGSISVSELEGRIGTLSSASSTIYEPTSTASSARSSIYVDSPISILPQGKSKLPLPTVPVPRYRPSRPPPVDSLRIARQRRASEPPEGSLFISSPRKKDSSGLKKLGIKLLRKVRW